MEAFQNREIGLHNFLAINTGDSKTSPPVRRLVAAMALATIAFVGRAEAAEIIRKEPNNPQLQFALNPNTGSYVYANSFVPNLGGLPSMLGVWLNDASSGGSSFRLEIWGGGSAGPDPFDIIATTGSLPPVTGGSLTFVNAPVQADALTLSAGNTYWFVATVSGESGPGEYQFGTHIKNSVYQDDGSHWFSNDSVGILFDGRGELPFEIAFQVSLLTPSLKFTRPVRFPPTRVGGSRRRPAKLVNDGISPLRVFRLRIWGPDRRSFSLRPRLRSYELEPGRSASLPVRFRATGKGLRRAKLTAFATTLAPEDPMILSATVSLRGSGAGPSRKRTN